MPADRQQARAYALLALVMLLWAGNSIVGAGSAAAPNAAKAEEGKWQGITSGLSSAAGFFI